LEDINITESVSYIGKSGKLVCIKDNLGHVEIPDILLHSGDCNFRRLDIQFEVPLIQINLVHDLPIAKIMNVWATEANIKLVNNLAKPCLTLLTKILLLDNSVEKEIITLPVKTSIVIKK